MEKQLDRRWKKSFVSVQERFNTLLKNKEQMACEFSNHQWKCMFFNIENNLERKKWFIGARDEAQKVVKNHVWFESWTVEWFEPSKN